MDFKNEYAEEHRSRFKKTLNVLLEHCPPPIKILDLGPDNPMAKLMRQAGYEVQNTPMGIDLDLNDSLPLLKDKSFDIVTSFEVFEHLVNPYGVLSQIRAEKLVTTVPLNLWFAKAYWNENDPFDRHFHEFEPRQFDMLLNKAGWEITYTEKWTPDSIGMGLRPILRYFTPRHYLVIAERKNSKTV